MIQDLLPDSSNTLMRRARASSDASIDRRNEVEEEKAEKRQRRKKKVNSFGRRVLTVGAITGVAAVAGPRIADVFTADRAQIDHTVTVRYGDTLSEISEEALIEKGNPDPSTQEINEYINDLKDASPDLQDGYASVDDEVNVPK